MALQVPHAHSRAAEPGGGAAVESVDWPEGETVFSYDDLPFTFRDVKDYHREIMSDGTIKPLPREEVFRAVNAMSLDMALHDDAVAKDPAMADNPEVVSLVDRFRLPRLKKIFHEKEVAPGVDATLDGYADTLPLPPVQHEISMILAEDQGKINDIHARLRKGEDFADIARKHSEGFSAEKGGKMGLVSEEKETILTRLELQNVRKVPEGGFTDPFRSRVGWAIVKVDKVWNPVDFRREQAKAGFDAYRIGKERGYFLERMEVVRAAAAIKVDQPLVDELAALVKEGKGVPEGHFSREIASVNGRRIYGADVRNILSTHSEESLNLYLDRRIEQELIAQEAERRGLADARFVKLLEMKRKHEIARVHLRNISEAAVRVTESDLKEYYDGNREKFAVQERRKLLAIETKDAAKAARALSQVKRGGDFREAAKAFNDRKEARESSGSVGFVRKEDLAGDVAKKAFSMKRGEIAGPIKIRTGEDGDSYVLLKVEEIRPAGIMPYDKVDKNVLKDRIVSRRRSATYEEMLPRLLSGHTVEFKGKAMEGKENEGKR